MPSKPNILILGPSGSGKSTSLSELCTNEKYASLVGLIDLERKGMPFLFDASKLAYFKEVENFTQAQTTLTEVKANHCGIVVIDSFTKYVELLRDHCKEKFTGWGIWDEYNKGIMRLLNMCKSMNKLVIFTALDEIVYIETPEGSRVSRVRCAVQGKEWEGKIEKEFLVVLTCTTKKDAQSKIKHIFKTATDGVSSTKAPPWLKLEEETTNDVSLVVAKLLEAKLL